MPRLVHLAPATLRRRIERSGLRAGSRIVEADGVRVETPAVFAMPVMPNFAATYQWTRELRRWRRLPMIAVHFNIPDDELVLVGRYGANKTRVSANRGAAHIAEAPWGQELIVCRDVAPAALRALRSVPQNVGWVETPDSAHAYECVCPGCLPSGSPDLLRRARASYRRGMERAHAGPDDPESLLAALQPLEIALERVGKRLEPKKLLSLTRHPNADVRALSVRLLGYFRREHVQAPIQRAMSDPDESVRHASLWSLLQTRGPKATWELVHQSAPELVDRLARRLEYWPGGDEVLRDAGYTKPER